MIFKQNFYFIADTDTQKYYFLNYFRYDFGQTVSFAFRCILPPFAQHVRMLESTVLRNSVEIVQNRRRTKCAEHARQKLRPSKRLELYIFQICICYELHNEFKTIFLCLQCRLDDRILAAAEGGGQNVSREFGGGGNVLQSVLFITTFGGLRNWGCSGRCLFLLREMTESRQKGGGGGGRIVGGGSKNVSGEGFFSRIYDMFSTPLTFPPPLAAL